MCTEKVKEKYECGAQNIEKLKKAGAVLLFGVDGMKLAENHEVYLGKYQEGDEHQKRWNAIKDDPQQNRKLDLAIMNFPYAGETWDSTKLWVNRNKDHANLCGGSFEGLSRILDESGEVILRINAGLAKNWDVNTVAAKAGFRMVAKAAFEQKDFPGYHPKRGCGDTPDSPLGLKDATTLVFQLMKTDDPEVGAESSKHK